MQVMSKSTFTNMNDLLLMIVYKVNHILGKQIIYGIITLYYVKKGEIYGIVYELLHSSVMFNRYWDDTTLLNKNIYVL